MRDEDYFVQVTYRRPPPENAPAKQAQPAGAPAAAPAGPESVQGSSERFRKLTPEERERELEVLRNSDNPRVRSMFEMIEKNESGQALPDGVRVRQGDLFAPGLVITGNPFPDWFDSALRKNGGFEWDNGCVSYVKVITGKAEAEQWAMWVISILEAERKDALANGRKPMADTTEVMVREDHRALLNDIVS